MPRARIAVLAVLASCDGAAGMSAPPPAPTTAVDVVDVGLVDTNHADPVMLDVPDGTVSLAWMIESDDDDPLWAGADAVDGAAVRTIVDDVRPCDPAASPNPAVPMPRAFVVDVPDAPAGAPLAPRYAFRPLRAATGPVHARAFLKRPLPGADPTLPAQVLDLHVFLIDRAAGGAEIGAMLARVDELLAGAGLAIGTTDRFTLDVPDELHTIAIDSTGDSPALFRLLAMSSRAATDALDLFVVDDIVAGSASGDPVIGLAGGIPVPPVRGTARSGVLVSGYVVRNAPVLAGFAVAHEIGHALGLFHTSELDGSRHDPLPDTPECAASADADHDGVLDPRECEHADGHNLMFWTPLDPLAGAEITADQGFVVRRHPLAR